MSRKGNTVETWEQIQQLPPKVCPRCQQEKDPQSYYIARMPSGRLSLYTYCKPCHIEIVDINRKKRKA